MSTFSPIWATLAEKRLGRMVFVKQKFLGKVDDQIYGVFGNSDRVVVFGIVFTGPRFRYCFWIERKGV